MRKILSVFLFITALYGLSAQDMAVATVRFKKTEPISGKELEKTISLLEQQEGRTLSSAERKQVLEKLIDQVLVLQAAESDRAVNVSKAEVEEAGMRLMSQQMMSIGAIPQGAVLTDKVQYKQLVEKQGFTLQEFEDTVRKQLLAEKYITINRQEELQAIGAPSEAEISAEYQKRTSEFAISDSVWFKQIFYDTQKAKPQEIQEKKEKAQNARRRLLNSSATFADLVSTESEDQLSKSQSGQIGPLMRGDSVSAEIYGESFVDAVFALNVNDVSDVLKSRIGYHIVQITEKKAAQLLPKDHPEVRTYLEQVIYATKLQEKFGQITTEILEELRKQSTINYFGEYR